MSLRPYRSALYIPGSKERALDKARGLACDAILFDLEDAVAAAEKEAARETLRAALALGGYGERTRIVRINPLSTEWGAADVAALTEMECDGVLLPKVNGAADVELLARAVPDLPIWAMMETPLGIINAAEIAAHPRIAGLVMGTNDLAREIGSRPGADRSPMLYALGACLMAARARGVVAIDGVYNAFRDEEGLRRECRQGRDLGFDGKSLIHPAQIGIANEAFAPDTDEVDLARRQIAAFEEARAEGQGVAVVDGEIVENLHVETARRTLARAETIARLDAEVPA